MNRKPRKRRDCVEMRLPSHLPRRWLGQPTSVDDDLDEYGVLEQEAAGGPVAAGITVDLRPVRKAPQREDDAYLEYVRRHRCCFVGCDTTPPSQPHHYPAKGMGGANGDDRLTVPLCALHHRFFHDHGHLPGDSKEQTANYFLRLQLDLLLTYLDGG